MKCAYKISALFFLTGLLLAFPFSTLAQEDNEDARERLQEIEEEMGEGGARQEDLSYEADNLAEVIADISEALVALAADISDTSARIEILEQNMGLLRSEQLDLELSLESQATNIMTTLAALQRLTQRPPEYVLVRPDATIDTIRTALLLSTTLPEIETKAEIIRMDLSRLESIKNETNSQKDILNLELASLSDDRESLVGLFARRRSYYEQISSDLADEILRQTALAHEAQDLRDLLSRIREAASSASGSRPSLGTPPPPGSLSLRGAAGRMTWPARGILMERYGESAEVGKTRGIRIQTGSSAMVLAPYDGQIVFAGSFRSYGQLLIIDHGQGYHSLLAGMDRIDGMVGQWVLAGEPVALMAEAPSGSSASISNRDAPELYVEIRHNGEPLNPLEWLLLASENIGGK